MYTSGTTVTAMPLYFMLSMLRDDPIPEIPMVKKQHWSYHGDQGPDFWASSYPMCAGGRQSPIDIQTRTAVYDPALTDFRFVGFERLSSTLGVGTVLNFTNTGHAATVMVTDDDVLVEGGGLPGRYRTAEFHFHWGADHVGSEHAIDGNKFGMEMHMVNFATKYETLVNAMTEPDGLAVMSVMFQLSQQDNPNFTPIANSLQHIHKAGDYRMLQGVHLRSLLPSDTSRYYRYSGSLTTPRCYETVTWLVFEEPMKISSRQVAMFRNLLHESGHVTSASASVANSPSRIVENCRPLQPVNGRRITRSFSSTNEPPGSSPGTSAPLGVCPTQRGYSLQGDHQPPLCVKYVSNSVQFAEAERSCAKDGGHVVHVKTVSVWNTLHKYLLGVNRQSTVWVGANDRVRDGLHYWSDGSRLLRGDPVWDPDTQGDSPNKDCVGMRAWVRLIEVYCTYRYPFFCEIDI